MPTNQLPPNQSTYLHYQSEHSDKVYHVYLSVQGNGQWEVTTEYGRRGSTLQSGSSVKDATHLEAEKKYRQVIASKTRKGYQLIGATPGAAAPVQPPKSFVPKAYLPQLLNPISIEEVDTYLNDDAWAMQTKIDGERRMISVAQTASPAPVVVGFNRKGNAVTLPAALHTALQTRTAWMNTQTAVVLDGEIVGETFHAFDIVESGLIVGGERFFDRLRQLEDIVAAINSPLIRLVKPSVLSEKREAYEVAKWLNAEGVVFKRLDAPYSAGRPNSGGPALKAKFVETATVRVASINDKRSIVMEMTDGDPAVFRPVGNCTIPANHEIPPVGAFVEVRYLYAYPGEGSLYQPVYNGQRNDQDETDCDRRQLKLKVTQEDIDKAATEAARAELIETHKLIETPLTQESGVAIWKSGDKTWRHVDLNDPDPDQLPRAVGPIYATRKDALADNENYVKENWMSASA